MTVSLSIANHAASLPVAYRLYLPQNWAKDRARRKTAGVPKEIKADEYRVSMLPVGVEELTHAGHRVLVEAGAGQGSGIADVQYEAAGATIVADAADIWAEADMIVARSLDQPVDARRIDIGFAITQRSSS